LLLIFVDHELQCLKLRGGIGDAEAPDSEVVPEKDGLSVRGKAQRAKVEESVNLFGDE